MEELTESARQCLVSQGIIIGTLSILNSLGLLLKGVAAITRANDILHFTSLTYLAILEVVCGITSFAAIAYVWWIVAAYRNRQLEVRLKYLDEGMSRGLIILILPLFLNFSAFIVSAIFLLLKTETSSTYDLKSAMSLYSTDVTRKIILDKLQLFLQCCGSQSLLDWFLIDWQNADLQPGQHLGNNTISDWDSVPFSCCCPEAPPPCVHHQLRIFGVGSLYTAGCADKLDELIFVFIVIALIMLFTSTFLMVFMMYSSRKLQTSARSAALKGDATAPGCWWILSPTSSHMSSTPNDRIPLLKKEKHKNERKKDSGSLADYWCKQNRILTSPATMMHKAKIIDSTLNEDWPSVKTRGKILENESSEDWTRRAYEASESTSTTSFMTTSLPVNSTPESRRSVSDTAVANLEVSHHFEHKVRPLYRT